MYKPFKGSILSKLVSTILSTQSFRITAFFYILFFETNQYICYNESDGAPKTMVTNIQALRES